MGKFRIVSIAEEWLPVAGYEGNYLVSDKGRVKALPRRRVRAGIRKAHIDKRGRHRIELWKNGTGFSPTYIEGARNDWGYKQWAAKMVDLFVEGSTGLSDYTCHQLLGENYHRIQTTLGKEVPLDDPSEIKYLLEVAEGLDLDEAKVWVELKWKDDVVT
jgi:hypothetical protein